MFGKHACQAKDRNALRILPKYCIIMCIAESSWAFFFFGLHWLPPYFSVVHNSS